MNRVFLKMNSREGKKFVVNSPAKIEHLLEHIKIETGKRIKVAIEDEGLALAKVIECRKDRVTLEVEDIIPASPQPYVLLVASSRPPTMKKILEHGTSLGVKKFIFFKGELSEKSYLTSKIYEKESLEDLLTLGIEQAGCFSNLPEVKIMANLEDAIKEVQGAKFLLSLSEATPFQQTMLDQHSLASMAIGPERGWTLKEEEFLLSAEFKPIKVSVSTLRVEIATFTALGQLEYLFKNRL